MALHDVDPNTTNRIEPMPQASDQNPTRTSDGTTAITNKQDSSSGASVSTRDATVKVNDGTVNRVSLGLLSDGSYGLKVSPGGVDVLTASDDQLVFNSSQNVFKIVDSGTVEVVKAANSSYAQTQVAHGQSYIPVVIGYVGSGGTSYQPTPYLGLHVDVTSNNYLGIGIYSSISVDATHITFYIDTGTTGTDYTSTLTLDFKYYILQETAN